MFEAENIRDWREHDVVDPDGKKIGQLESVYVDTGTDQPAFGSVRIGMVGRHRLTFVPLDRAVVLPGQLKVAYSKSQVKGAPTIDTDGELPATDEPELFKHYGLEYQPGVSGERRLARRLQDRRILMVVFLLLVLAAVALGILGAVIKGLLFLLFIGIAVFIVAFVVLGASMRRRRPVR
ncbi:MAG TPA: PRC-barrel domain-containing protein [Trebonia sp.]|nr:PRC-barrel domain-containing protein [Trebonia sp.]